jgi:CHAT domain-containing protein
VQPEKLGSSLVVADPDYDALAEEPSPSTQPTLLASNQRRSGDLANRGVRFQSLPGFKREADAVAKSWRAARPKDPLETLQGTAASEEKLAEIKRPRFLYFITHGFFLPDLEWLEGQRNERGLELVGHSSEGPSLPAFYENRLLRSGLALAGANRWKERSEHGLSDGLLTAYEIQNLDLWGTELVVLSACETGLGEVSNVGEGVLGLRRAFQNAGAQTVVASLWKVPDQETERLMARFLELWLKGKPKAEALRSAQLEMIQELRQDKDEKRRTAPPLLWAGFICHGKAD